MFEYLTKFDKILVTGPQRSGTTIAARMIARDTGKRFLPEEYVWVDSEEALKYVVNTESSFVLQCPALQHEVHLPHVGGKDDLAVVFMDRPVEEILSSASRSGWGPMVAGEFAKWGLGVPDLVAVKQKSWHERQKHLIRHPFTVVYSSLAQHPLWVAREHRDGFHIRQTEVGGPPVWIEGVQLPLSGDAEMKVATAVTVAACLAASGGSDLKYELAVREAFADLEAKVESIRTEAGVEDSDRLVPVLMPRRSLWRHAEGGGFFERLNNGFWVQKMGGTGEAKLFNTSDRTQAYVEIGHVGGRTVIRLYEDHMDVRHENSTVFKHHAKGAWER